MSRQWQESWKNVSQTVVRLCDCYVRQGRVRRAEGVFLAGIETRFQEGHAALPEALAELNAKTNAQTNLLEEVCSEVKTMNEKIDVFIVTHGSSWAHQAGRCRSRKVFSMCCKRDRRSLVLVSILNKHLDDTGLFSTTKSMRSGERSRNERRS